MKQRIVLIGMAAFLSIAADQGTKIWARHSLMPMKKPVVLVEGYLDLEYHENPGFAFGMGRNIPWGRYVLIGVGIIALFVMWRIIRDVKHRRRMADLAFGLIAGGAIGNMVDRVYIGRVVDFILMHWNRKYIWPAYNIADAVLVVGVVLLILVLGRKQEPGPKTSKSKGPRRQKPKTRGKKR